MLTEYEVRRRMDTIRASRFAPLRKARLLLRLGKSLHHQAECIAKAKDQAAIAHDRRSAAVLSRMASRTEMLHEDVREAAQEMLRGLELTLSSS